jgi:hypothetical protein
MALRPVRALMLAGALVAAAGATAACDVSLGEGGGVRVNMLSGRASDEWTRTYAMAEGGRLQVKNLNGSIVVEAASGSSVEVKAERIAKASTDEAARELLQKIEIREQVTGDTVRLETHAPRGGMATNHEVKYVLQVPASIRVEAQTTNGGIDIRAVPNAVTASTVNGGVKGDGLSGHIQASTTNGGVTLSLVNVPEQGVRAEAVNGGVRVAVPRSARLDVLARVTNGGVRVDDGLSLEVVGERSRRRLEGKLNGGGPRVELSTTNGGVSISAR